MIKAVTLGIRHANSSMIQQIFCYQCGGDGSLPASLKLTYQREFCDKNRSHTSEYGYHFCSLDCARLYLTKWNDGLPCQSCGATGWAFTLKENGACRECDGTGKVNAVQP